MKNVRIRVTLLAFLILGTGIALAQKPETIKKQNGQTMKEQPMKTFLIERDLPEAGKLTEEQLKGISQKSCNVLNELDQNNIQWLQSYVTEDKIYCVYRAKNKELIKQHAEKGGFPCNSIKELSTTISPATAQN